MENQEQRNGTNVVGDIRDGLVQTGKMTGNPLKYTWNFFGMAIASIGSIVLLKGNQVIRSYNEHHYSSDELEEKNHIANTEMNSKLSAFTGAISAFSFRRFSDASTNTSDHGLKKLK